MNDKIKKEILNSVENDRNTIIQDKKLLVDNAIELIKEFDLNNTLKSIYDDKDKFNECADKQINIEQKRLETSLSFNINNIDYSLHLNSILKHHINHKTRFSTDILIIIYRYIELEDENKKLTLTDKQYKTWLESNYSQYITTKQFEILYGLTATQQKGLRTRLNDSLPYIKLFDNSNILYDRNEVEKWLENYGGKMKL